MTNTTDNTIEVAEIDRKNFQWPLSQNRAEYKQALWTETLRCGPVFYG